MLPRLATIALLCGLVPAHADDGDLARGLAIATEADRRDSGFGDSVADLTMVLANAHGQVSERRLTIKTLEAPEAGGGDWSLTVFERPADIKGTALLTQAEILEPDRQWLYLPALKRVKRIASVNKSGPFMGSEFAFEDMAAPEVGKYSHRYLRDEACGDAACHLIERTPLYQHSGYSKLLVWLDVATLRPQRIDYFDRRGAVVKTLMFDRYRQYGGRYWRAHDMYMVNHQTGKSTRLLWSDYRFATGLAAADFSRAGLARQ